MLRPSRNFTPKLQLNPNDFRSHYMLGYIALKQRNLPEAESELLSALAEAPRDLQSHLQLAEVYTDTNRLPEAEKELRAAISAGRRKPGQRRPGRPRSLPTGKNPGKNRATRRKPRRK